MSCQKITEPCSNPARCGSGRYPHKIHRPPSRVFMVVGPSSLAGFILSLAAASLLLRAARKDPEEVFLAGILKGAFVDGSSGSDGIESHNGETPGANGEVLVYRLVDSLSSARYRGPDPARAYRSLQRHWRKMLDPHANLPASMAHLRLKVAFRNPDVLNYMKDGESVRKKRERLGSGERQWSRTDGVYESRTALFAPLAEKKSRKRFHQRRSNEESRWNTGENSKVFKNESSTGNEECDRHEMEGASKGSDIEFTLDLPENAVLEFGVAVLPRHELERTPVRFVIELESGRDSGKIWSREVTHENFMDWSPPVRLSLAEWGRRRVTLRLSVYGYDGGGLWMDPKIWADGKRGGDNLLVILVDTLRPDGVGALEGVHAVTPNMDRLVQNGVRFTNYFSNGSFTRNSLIAKFASNYASSLGLAADRFAFRDGVKERFYGLRAPLFPLKLENHGFEVFSVMNNFFSFPYVNVGVDLGFSNFTDVRHRRDDSPAMTRAAIDFLRRNRDRRFFLFVHYETLHGYNKDTRDTARRFNLDEGVEMSLHMRAYLQIANEMDEEVGSLMEALEELGLDENTLVVLTSDHGEVFHPGHAHHVPYYNMNMLHQHARSVWDEVLRVPMVWTRKGKLPADFEVNEIVRGIDFAPSLLEFLGLPQMNPVAGKSFMSMIPGAGRFVETHESEVENTEKRISSERYVYAEGFHINALRTDRYKYIWRDHESREYVFRGRTFDRPEELFDLDEDPHELNNISRQRPDILKKLRKAMRRIRRESAFENLSFTQKPGDSVTKSTGGYHLRLCAGPEERRVSGRIVYSCENPELMVWSVRGNVGLHYLGEGSRGLHVDMTATSECTGFDWTAAPACEAELELESDGVILDGPGYRAGPFGLKLLKRPVLSISDAANLESGKQPAVMSPENPGLYVWQSPFRGSAWLDSESSERSKTSDELMQMNLRQAGYVHAGGER